ncbi:MAG: hypothetical protein KatS3mg039_0954 [Candidatus Kapaibacterium sp.]|nr:MAG: hypothetical protein KatS3mg039_0954 [Candidatus Kapabacteria bacterium]
MIRQQLKQLELRLRRFYLRRSERPFRGQLVVSPRCVVDTDNPRILLLRQDRIGDVICSTPVLRALRTRFPQACIDILLSRNNAALAPMLHTWCNRWWRYDKTLRSYLQLRRQLRSARYDVVVDLMDNPSTTSTLFLQATNAPIRIGVYKQNAWVYTHCVPLLDRSQYHYVERIAQLLLPFGIDPAAEPLDLLFPLSQAARDHARALIELDQHPERNGHVLIHLSSRHQTHQWDDQSFAHTIEQLRTRFPSIAIGIGVAPEDRHRAHKLAQQTGTFVIPPCSFEEYAAVLSHARLLITPDTAVVHVAAAFKLPAVVLYHQHDPELLPWYPYRSPYRALVARCTGTINTIPPQAVLDAAIELLLGTGPTQAERIFAPAVE